MYFSQRRRRCVEAALPQYTGEKWRYFLPITINENKNHVLTLCSGGSGGGYGGGDDGDGGGGGSDGVLV